MSRVLIQTRLVDFLRSVTGQTSLTADTDLAEAGATDSLTMMDLLVFIETEFCVRLGYADLNPNVFKTPQTLGDLIARQLEANGQLVAV